MKGVTLSALTLYPVKSMRGTALQRSRVHAFGLLHDRRWMLIDDEGRFLSQRKLARMCLMQSTQQEYGVLLSAPGLSDLTVVRPEQGAIRRVQVWKDECDARDAGDEAAAWCSGFLQQSCRLVWFPDDEVRAVDPRFARDGDRTAFSDGFPLLLISQASLDGLNARLPQSVDMRRFRPNLVVAGTDAHAEDSWKRIRIGSLAFRVAKPCSRCVIPSIDPDSAEKWPELTRTLTQYRRRDGKVFFGQNLIPDGDGELELGMPVEVLE